MQARLPLLRECYILLVHSTSQEVILCLFKEVHHGNTVMDYMKEERERGITIRSACISFNWANHQINLIDTPGHIDFNLEVERSLQVLDAAVVIIDGVNGVETQSETVWRQSNKFGISKLVFVNKLDRIGGNYEKSISSIAVE